MMTTDNSFKPEKKQWQKPDFVILDSNDVSATKFQTFIREGTAVKNPVKGTFHKATDPAIYSFLPHFSSVLS